MIALLIFSFVTFSAHNGTKSYQECIESDFKMKNACADAKKLYDAGKSLCSIQGKGFEGNSSCK
jgi:hypothetical protein